MGAPIALVRLILCMWPEHKRSPRALFRGRYRELMAHFTVTSATDGNHGKRVAAAAQTLGCRCAIVPHANVSAEREEAIVAYCAKIVRLAGRYNESVEEAARVSVGNGWHAVSDRSCYGYVDIPRDVMQGYVRHRSPFRIHLQPTRGATERWRMRCASCSRYPGVHLCRAGFTCCCSIDEGLRAFRRNRANCCSRVGAWNDSAVAAMLTGGSWLR